SDEVPRGVHESPRTCSDGMHFHNRDDIGVLRRSAESCNVSGEAVSVGRCEEAGPEGFMKPSGPASSQRPTETASPLTLQDSALRRRTPMSSLLWKCIPSLQVRGDSWTPRGTSSE